MELASTGDEGDHVDDQVSTEFAKIREALEDLRRRPAPFDADTLRHIVAASLADAGAPPPNLLVTAIRRLDRLDARLENIEIALGGPGGVPEGATRSLALEQPQEPNQVSETAVSLPSAPSPDSDAIADAVARRLTDLLSAQTPIFGATRFNDLIAALRPLLYGAARNVLRRTGGEPSPQAIELLQRTALDALEAAADVAPLPLATPALPAAVVAGADPVGESGSMPMTSTPPLDLAELASVIAAQVAAQVAAKVAAKVAETLDLYQRPSTTPLDQAALGTVVADAVLERFGHRPAESTVLSPVDPGQLLSAVANVESAVAQMAVPTADIVASVERLQTSVDALVMAAEKDQSRLGDDVLRSLAQGQRVERSIGHVLTALAAVVDHLQGQVQEPGRHEDPNDQVVQLPREDPGPTNFLEPVTDAVEVPSAASVDRKAQLRRRRRRQHRGKR